ncbi:hypothetical protein BDW42DRAFT_187063 [Aspergillus taichungensis]|uniref:DUF6594 domain-containing protein n=1 Tax=Aspergillus taichungensis TaxID=482145 RepID=A0A2J5HNX2_9EURO|nr:hypothetical protein BDW42DRAFT_187063 [Aspergillus taichungensis]
MDLATVPESFYRDLPSYHGPPLPPSPPRSPEEDLHRTSRRPRRNTHSSQHASGYGLLAWRLSASTDSEEPRLPPLYRRFEDLNHRVLLHLQDEIAQMEEELRVLDECDEMHRASAAEKDGSKMLPASRRMDVQAGVYSSLHYQREELMSALIRKTEQYNNALSAYSRVLQTLPQASDENVDAYRTWMHGNSPIAAVESRFLDHPKDLVSLTPPVTPIGPAPTPSVYSAIIIASAAILLPLLAFSMIRDFWGRVLLVALVGGASASFASTTSAGSEQLVASQDGWRCAGL